MTMADKTIRSGHCGLTASPESHTRCVGAVQGYTCHCECHRVAAGEASPPVLSGIVEMSNNAYHAERDHWSSSFLKKQLPERYKPAKPGSDALAFGTLFHTLLLEPDELDVYTILNPAKVGLKTDGTAAASPTSTSAWKTAVAEVEAAGRFVVLPEDWDRAQLMADVVRQHPVAKDLLAQPRTVEESVFTVDGDGNRIKARFDIRIPGAIVDLKSTLAKPGADSLARTVIDYGYDLSAAHYLDVAQHAGIDASTFLLLFISKDEFPKVTVAEIDATFLARGRALRALAIERLTTDAPPYEGADTCLTLTPPPWSLHGLNTTVSGYTADLPEFDWSIA